MAQLAQKGAIVDKVRDVRPRKNTTRLHRQIAQVKRQTPRAAARVLTSKVNAKNKAPVSVRTVRRALHEMNYHWRLPGRKKLTSLQKAARLEFAREHEDDVWRETWSFDEAYFNLNRHSNKCWVSTSTEESVQEAKRTSAQEKISIGICFAISRDRKSALCFLPKNWSGRDLVKVFEETLLPSIQWPKKPSQRQRFIIDNDGRHQMDVWKRYVLRVQLHAISPWPSNSPDLNPIENLFAWMKRYVEDRSPTNEQELRQTVTDAFNNIPEAHLAHYMDSLKSRMTQTIAANGARINY
jgi:ketohexokinase/beta-glucosidase